MRLGAYFFNNIRDLKSYKVILRTDLSLSKVFKLDIDFAQAGMGFRLVYLKILLYFFKVRS